MGDSNFGGDGIVKTDLTSQEDWAYGVAIQADGNTVAVGGASAEDFAVVRYCAA